MGRSECPSCSHPSYLAPKACLVDWPHPGPCRPPSMCGTLATIKAAPWCPHTLPVSSTQVCE